MATVWMDNEMSRDPTFILDGTLESMWIVSACDKCKSILSTSQGHKQIHAGAQNAQQLRRDCAWTSTSTLWINWLDAHKLMPDTRSAPHNEARRSWTGRHFSG